MIMLIRRNAVEVWHISDFQSQPLDRMCLFVCLFVAIKPEKLHFASCVERKVKPQGVITGLWFLVCYATTQLATPLHQRRIQVVRSNKVAQKRLTESNGTPAMDFGREEIRKRRYTHKKNRTKYTNTIVSVTFDVSVCTMINLGQITVFIDLFVTHGPFFFGRGTKQEIFMFFVRANFVGKKRKKS